MNKYKYKIYQYLKAHKYNYPIDPYIVFNQLLKSQYWSKEQLIQYQISTLNKLLLLSKNSSSYYRDILGDINLPIKELNEFNKKIPRLTKEIIKTQYDELKTKNFTIDFKHQTSGSTGDPVTIYISSLAEIFRKTGYLRFLSWWNIKPYDNSVRIVGRKKSVNNLRDKVKQKFKNRYDINVFNLNKNSIHKYFNDIEKFKPVYINGYKSAILQFSELLEQEKLFFKKFRFRLAVVTSEVLLQEEKNFIERILGCKVANQYGCAEAGQIAYECPKGSMHVFEEAIYLNTNENNEVFLTEIHNDSIPLINYKNNDLVSLSEKKCKCGISSRIICEIKGRVDDFLIKPNGEIINHYLFIFIIMELDDIGFKNSILKWKVIQYKNNFQLIIVPTQNYNSKVEQYIKKRLHEEIGEDIIIEFTLVKSIPRDKSGKLRSFVRIE